MKEKQRFSIAERLKSFTYAFNGLCILFNEEHNARIHIAVAVCVTAAGFFLEISVAEWVVVIFAIGSVFAMELINSAVENIADFISPAKHEKIKRIKDLSAAAVLMSVIAAVIVGLIIFLPKIILIFY